MSSTESHTTERLRLITTWVLILGFLCQPILSYLVTPMQVVDKRGLTAVVCTLKGIQKEVFIELPAIDGQAQPVEDCAAIKLYQLAGTTQISPPLEVPYVLFEALGVVDQTAEHQHHSLHFCSYSSRAPPVIA